MKRPPERRMLLAALALLVAAGVMASRPAAKDQPQDREQTWHRQGR